VYIKIIVDLPVGLPLVEQWADLIDHHVGDGVGPRLQRGRQRRALARVRARFTGSPSSTSATGWSTSVRMLLTASFGSVSADIHRAQAFSMRRSTTPSRSSSRVA